MRFFVFIYCFAPIVVHDCSSFKLGGEELTLLFCPEHQNLQQRYEKRERECEAKNKEKEDMMVMLNMLKERLEKESSDHKRAKMHLAEVSAQLEQTVSSLAII